MHCALEALADQKKCDNASDKKEQQYEYRRLTIGEIHSLRRSLRVQDDGCSTGLRLACYLTECIEKRSCLIQRFIGRCFVRCLCDQHRLMLAVYACIVTIRASTAMPPRL